MWIRRNAPPRIPLRVKIRGTKEYAGMVELVDSVDLGSTARACRFESCCPHQEKGDRKVSLFLAWRTGLEEGGTANGGAKNVPVTCFLARGRVHGTLTAAGRAVGSVSYGSQPTGCNTFGIRFPVLWHRRFLFVAEMWLLSKKKFYFSNKKRKKVENDSLCAIIKKNHLEEVSYGTDRSCL